MIDAAVDTLHKAWRAGIDLAMRAADHPRLAAIARLEAAVIDQLPAGMMRPVDIVAPRPPASIMPPPSLAPWRSPALPNFRRAGGRCSRPSRPTSPCSGRPAQGAFPHGSTAQASRSCAPAQAPEVGAVSAATAYHEAIEAMRWARHLLASGVSASEIAIATASPADYDDHFLALRADANIDLHFVHGVRTVTTREGQAAAALADIVVRGLSQSRLRRLAALCRDGGAFQALPEGWLRVLPTDAPFRRWPPGTACLPGWRRKTGLMAPITPALRAAIEMLAKAPKPPARSASLPQGPRACDLAQGAARRPRRLGRRDAGDPETGRRTRSVRLCRLDAGQRARGLAPSLRAPPRAQLLALAARHRRGPADPGPHHPDTDLDPLPVNLADRRDFETILATTGDAVVLSRARRDSDGRLLGRSPCSPGTATKPICAATRRRRTPSARATG
jgi:hypothetical protein